MLSYLSSSQCSGMKALQGWSPSQKTGKKHLAYLYHLLIWCPEFWSKSKRKGHVVFWSSPFGPQRLLGLFNAWARGDLPSKLQIGWICPFPKSYIRPLRVVRGVLVQKTFVFVWLHWSELSRFMNASCVRITFQLGQSCQDHFFVYMMIITRGVIWSRFVINKRWEKTASMLSYLCAFGCVFCFLLLLKNDTEMGMPCCMAERQPQC